VIPGSTPAVKLSFLGFGGVLQGQIAILRISQLRYAAGSTRFPRRMCTWRRSPTECLGSDLKLPCLRGLHEQSNCRNSGNAHRYFCPHSNRNRQAAYRKE